MDLINLIWTLIVGICLNVVPGMVIYINFRGLKKELLEIFALSFICSKMIWGFAFILIDFMGGSTKSTFIIVMGGSFLLLIKTFQNKVHPIRLNKTHLVYCLLPAFIMASLAALPALLNPWVVIRSDNKLHIGLV
jgi:hypothetical protein